jgi:phage-related protein
MSFDAGSIIAHMDLDDAEFDRKLKADVARIEAFERRTHEAKISAELDPSGLSRARQQMGRFDQQITQDAQQRARNHGSVLGALMGLFGGGRAAGGPAGGSGGSGRSLLGGLLGGAGPVPTGLPVGARSLLLGTAGGVGLGALPALLGGILPLGVGAIGAGFAGIGAKALIGTKNQQGQAPTQGPLYAEAQAAMKSIKSAFDAGIQPLIGPLRQAFTVIPRLIHSLGPDLRQAFAGAGTLILPLVRGLGDLAHAVLPLLGRAFRATAPLIRPLIDGFGKLLAGLLPGVIALLRAASPAVHALAGILGELGSGIGLMLRDFAPAVRASSVIFKALGDVIAAVFPIIGKLAAVFARSLAPVFVILAGVIRQLLPYLTIIGKVFASLAGAVLQDLVGVFGSLAKLLVLISPSFRILASALSQTFAILESSGVFGVLATALEKIVPVLARLINQVVRALAPALPPLIASAGQLVQVLVLMAASGLTAVLKALTPVLVLIAQLTSHLATWLNSMHLLTPALALLTAGLLASKVGMIAGKAAIAAWFVACRIAAVATRAFAAAQAILSAAMDANPIILVTLAIIALGVAAYELYKHWNTVWGFIKRIAEDAWSFLTHGWGQFLFPGLTAIRYAVEFVRDHWRQAWDDIKGAGLAAWHFIHDNIVSPLVNTFTQTIPAAFRAAVRDIGNGWDAIKNVVRAPVAWVVDHVIDGLISAFDWISGKVGGPHINPVHPFGLATGGRIPGYGGGDRHMALLEGGEAVVSKETTSAHAATLASWGVPGFQRGGAVGQAAPNRGGPLGFLDHIWHGIADIGKITAAVFTGNTTALANAIKSMIPGGLGGATADMAGLLESTVKTLIGDVVHALVGYGGGASANAIVRDALGWLGKVPYVWGGTAVPGGADCSGFVQTIYRRHGLTAPRTSEAQGNWVRRSSPAPGGLAFYNSPAGGAPPGHVAIIRTPTQVISQGGGMGPQLMALHGMPLMWTGIPPGGFRTGARGQYGLSGLESLWMSAGGPAGAAHVAAAIALAESGGNPRAHNPSGASGLWQILGQVFPGDIFSPFINARNAVRKYYQAGGFSPWVTYEDGQYRRFMDQGGWMQPGVAYANATGQPEAVLTPRESEAHVMLARAADQMMRGGGSGDLLAELKAMRRELAQLLKRAPAATGAAVGDAMNTGSRQASLRAQYSAR